MSISGPAILGPMNNFKALLQRLTAFAQSRTTPAEPFPGPTVFGTQADQTVNAKYPQSATLTTMRDHSRGVSQNSLRSLSIPVVPSSSPTWCGVGALLAMKSCKVCSARITLRLNRMIAAAAGRPERRAPCPLASAPAVTLPTVLIGYWSTV